MTREVDLERHVSTWPWAAVDTGRDPINPRRTRAQSRHERDGGDVQQPQEQHADHIVLSDSTRIPLADGLVLEQFGSGTRVTITYRHDRGGEMVVESTSEQPYRRCAPTTSLKATPGIPASQHPRRCPRSPRGRAAPPVVGRKRATPSAVERLLLLKANWRDGSTGDPSRRVKNPTAVPSSRPLP